MPESNVVGLCSTCCFGESCALRGKRGGDALYCEMFRHRNLSREQVEPGPSDVSDRVEKRAATGLCATCQRVGECTLHRPESGVWHCEEYC